MNAGPTAAVTGLFASTPSRPKAPGAGFPLLFLSRWRRREISEYFRLVAADQGSFVFRKIIVTGLVVITIALGCLYVHFQYHSSTLSDQPAHFDLYMDEMFFSQEGSLFDTVPEHLARPVNWSIDPGTFTTLDTFILSLTNTSGERFYYESWGAPLTRLRKDLIIYRSGEPDTLPFSGFGCWTGIFVAPVKKNEILSRVMYNPLMYDHYTNYELPITSDSLPFIFKELYGDSVKIRFGQPSYSFKWSNYSLKFCFRHISQFIPTKFLRIGKKETILLFLKGNQPWKNILGSKRLLNERQGTGPPAPMHYILFYKTIEGYIEKRAPFREEHLKLACALSASIPFATVAQPRK